MVKILETERLMLRHWRCSDFERVFEICRDPDVMEHVGDGNPLKDIDDAKKILSSITEDYDKNGFSRWAVVQKFNGRVIGSCGFARLENGEIDLGYLFEKKVWGKGFATEAAKACLNYGFQRLKFAKVVARVDFDFLPSQRVLEKIGFKKMRIEKSETGDDWVFEIEVQDNID